VIVPCRCIRRAMRSAASTSRRRSRATSVATCDCRSRSRWPPAAATPPQVGLHLEERRRNLADAFVAGAARGRRVAVVDDVTTTGTTLQELARVLLQSGAVAVDAWCVARAERHGIQGGSRFEPSPPAG